METNQLPSNYIIEDVSDVWPRLRFTLGITQSSLYRVIPETPFVTY